MTLIIPPKIQNIGFTVKRLFPSQLQQRVGPFIFFDHMGPAHFEAETTAGDVRQHPHIGLATVTYLFSGAMMHRDSLGVVQRIEPGEINLMTAGRGIVHSERMPEDIRTDSIAVEGIQTWLALPVEEEDCEPSFTHYAAHQIPTVELEKISARLLIGKAFGVESPVKTASPTVYIDMQMEVGAEYLVDFPNQEIAIYLVEGKVKIDGEDLEVSHVAVVDTGSKIVATENTRLMLFGGESLAGARCIFWNFVASSREKIRAASGRWADNQFALVPGETEFIPLPKID